MNTYKRRIMEMLERVDQLGKKPELTLTTIITALLATVNVNLVAMRAWVAGQVNGLSGFREGAAARRGLKSEIYGTLRDMSEIAKGLELAGDLGVSEQFRLPSRPSYATVLATARSFVTNATPMAAAFTGRGLSATFLADLEAKITAFDVATGGKHEGGADRVGSTAALDAAASAGLKAVQELRTIMRVHLRSAQELLAAWTAAARVDRRAPAAPAEGAPTPPPSGS